jgi:hypothetical protein
MLHVKPYLHVGEYRPSERMASHGEFASNISSDTTEKRRLKGLLREFETYLNGRGKLKQFRTEAVRAGFKQAWNTRNYESILRVAERLPEFVLQEDNALLMYYDNANFLVG